MAHPWRVLAAWIVAVTAIIVFSPNLDDYTSGNQQSFLPKSFESVQAQDVGNEDFPTVSGATGSLVVYRADGAQMTPTDVQTALGLAATLQSADIAGVTSVTSGPQSVAPDGMVVALQVTFDGQPGEAQVDDAVPVVRGDAENALTGTGLVSGLTGNAAILVDSDNAYNHAENVITIATVVVIVTLLSLIFRSPIIAVLPVIVIGVVFRAVRGLTADLAALFDFQVSTILDAILVVVLFGVGTDYIVFLLFRYRERLRRGDDPTTALIFATSVVGKVVASSALTVIGAFAALLLARLGSLTTLAPGLIVAVASMLITALTLIPAFCALLGRHLFWPLGPGRESARSPFVPIGRFVAGKPAIVAGAVAVVLVVLASFSSGFTATYDTLDELPGDTPSRQAFDTLAASFPPGALSPTQVFVTEQTPIPAESLGTLETNLSQVSGVASVAPPRPNQAGTAALIDVVLADDPYSNDAIDVVQGQLRTVAHDSIPGAEVYVGGETSTLVDVRTQLRSDTRHVFPAAAVIIAVILGLLLLAVLAPLNLLLCVGLTFVATLGALVLVFIHAVGLSGIDFSIPIVLYLFVVAIGTDYNILLASRLREEFVGGHDPAESAAIAISNDAPTVSAAGTILALTFASLILTGLDNLVELGAGVAIGVLVAAMVMAPLLVPALSVLQGRWFWWPTRFPGAVPATDATPRTRSG